MGWIRSAHDCSEGGLAVALAECCITGPQVMGADIDGGAQLIAPLHKTTFLFAETQSRIIVTIKEKDLQPFLKLARLKKCPVAEIGLVAKKSLKINELIDVSAKELKALWEGAFEKIVSKGV